MRVLVLSTTTGYQLRAFDEAAERLGVELAFATDRCRHLEDPWRDRAVAVRFHDEAASLAAIEEAARDGPLDGILAVGDRPVVLASLTARRLGLRGNPPDAARITSSKLKMRQAIDAAGLPAPWYRSVAVDSDPAEVLAFLRAGGISPLFPCVVKPLAMAASRGVLRVDDPDAFHRAFARVRTLLQRRDVRIQRNELHKFILVESYIPGAEYALEGVLERGELKVLALFDKPDPLEGPTFEEAIYVTPSRLPEAARSRVCHTITAACRAIGLTEGPLHAEARVNEDGVYVIEVAARPIGGLCSRALRFVKGTSGGARGETPGTGSGISLEELLLRHAVGATVREYVREPDASGVMMIPVPRRGVFRRVERMEEALANRGIWDIVITARPDQMLVPLPEGASYPGFIFARGASPDAVEAALREAHATLQWIVDRPVEIVAES